MKREAVGSRKPTPDQYCHEPMGHEDETRVQRSAIANLVQFAPGASAFAYWWYLKHTRWSRTYNSREQAVDALRLQGFGSYVDLDGRRVRFLEKIAR